MPNLIGTAPDQVPVNGFLGNMAFQNKEGVITDLLSTTALTVTGTIATSLGSAAAPSYTFIGDTNTGIFSPAADTIAFSEGGGFANPVAAIGTGSTAVGIGGTALTPNVPAKIAVAYGSNMALVQDAGTPVTNASAASVVGSSLAIGYGGGAGSEICGHIRSIRYYPTRLSNAQLQALTA